MSTKPLLERRRKTSQAKQELQRPARFSAARAQSVPISGEILKSKAQELATELDPDHEEWSCSNGWLSRWKVRHNISYKAVSGENAAVSKKVCEDWKKSTLSPLLQRYHPNDVFNADETALFGDSFLTRLIQHEERSAQGERKVKKG